MEGNNPKRIRIAFFTADWNRELTSVTLTGLRHYLDRHSDITVQIFDCFGFATHSVDETFKYEIFELPDLSEYDAVIVQGHQIMDEYALHRLEERILKASLPAVSIGVKMEGCTFVGTDDYNAAACITEHLITEHHARTFLFLKGAERTGFGEAYDRRMGFADALIKFGLPETSASYFEGKWDSEYGKIAARELLSKGGPLPDAIVSANDDMALGAMAVLKDAGIRVPEDILVTGFDDVFSASISEPRLTTIRRDFKTVIKWAMDTLMSKLRGNEVPMKIFCPYEAVFSGSCGCAENTRKDLIYLKKRFYSHYRRSENFYYLQDKMTACLFDADDPARIFEILEEHAEIYDGAKVFLYLNEEYYKTFTQKDGDTDPYIPNFSDSFVLCACNSEDEAFSCGEDHIYRRVNRTELMKIPPVSEEPFSLFYALHFKKALLGFLILTAAPTISDMSLHESITNLLVFAVENGRRKAVAQRLNSHLNSLYVTDSLTGLYNRFGYERFKDELVGSDRDQSKPVRVLFLDIDNMKGINDSYGHEWGDKALLTVSSAMKKSCRGSDFKMRYGGDEFVIITSEGNADIKGRILAIIDKVNESGRLPFELSVSIGDFVWQSESLTSPDDLLVKADELMYREKGEKR